MEKEEILEKSRQENKNLDLEELEVRVQANSAALGVGIILCTLIGILESVLIHRNANDVWLIFFGMLGTVFLMKYRKRRKVHELVLCVFYYLFALVYLVLLVRELL